MPIAAHVLAMTDDVELVVAGGGLNGMLLGIACADAGLRVAVIDRQDPATLLGEAVRWIEGRGLERDPGRESGPTPEHRP